MFSQHSSGRQHLVADEALVPSGGGAGVRARVRLELGAAARALAAVRALQRHRAVLAPSLLARRGAVPVG